MNEESIVSNPWKILSEQCSTFEEKQKVYYQYLESPEWRLIRDMVVDRDENKCTKCEETENLRVHHLHYKHIYEEMDHLEDLLTLCKGCHEKEHPEKIKPTMEEVPKPTAEITLKTRSDYITQASKFIKNNLQHPHIILNNIEEMKEKHKIEIIKYIESSLIESDICGPDLMFFLHKAHEFINPPIILQTLTPQYVQNGYSWMTALLLEKEIWLQVPNALLDIIFVEYRRLLELKITNKEDRIVEIKLLDYDMVQNTFTGGKIEKLKMYILKSFETEEERDRKIF